MIKEKLVKYITNENEIKLFKEELEYANKHQLLDVNVLVHELPSQSRFANAYIERCDKETESLICEESYTFLENSIQYFKQHKNEFIYVESQWFELIGVDAVSFEVDDVFGNYDVMLGLKLQKKYRDMITAYVKEHLNDDFDLMFDQNEGLWNFNFSLNNLNGFDEEMSISEAYTSIYSFLFKLVDEVE
ncbi:branched-chain amino acid aminotransferase [Bacillus timonensis]|nr:branched-chain amino acid aminotransferase [Bacillus timonensis]